MRISVILLILLLLVGNVGNAVSVDSSKGKKILANAYQDFAALDQYHLDVIITSLIPYQNNMLHIIINNSSDMQTKPVLAKGTMKITMEAPDKAIALKMIYFFEEADKQLICYSNINGDKWIKQSLPYITLDRSTKHSDYITNLSILKEDNDEIDLKVTLNGNYIFKEFINQTSAENFSIEQSFSNINDFDYTMKIDKKTGKAKLDIDLSDLIGQIGKNIIEINAANAQEKEALLKICNNIKSSATVTISRLDTNEAIIIPAEIKAQAVESDRQLLTATSPDPAITAAITPPRVKTSPIIYPLEARRNFEEGTVLLKFTITATGKLENPEILKSSGSEILDAAALASIQQWELFPAMYKGKPITISTTAPISFRLKKEALPPPAEEEQEMAAAVQ